MPHKKGTSLDGIRTIEDLKLRCYVDPVTDCWHCRCYKVRGTMPQVHFVPPGETEMTKTTGRRAALHLATGEPVPKGHVVFARADCDSEDCVNPAHLRSGTRKQWGIALQHRGTMKDRPAKIAAALRTAASRRVLTPDQVRQILQSPESGRKLAEKFGVSSYAVLSARRRRTYKDVPCGATSIFTVGG